MLLGLPLLLAFLVMLLGASSLIGRKSLIVGFGLLPVLLSYGGFLGIWNIWVTSAAACLFFAYGIWTLRAFRWKKWMLIPAIILLVAFFLKFRYLLGDIGGGDESRSIMFTSSLASNALKPAYPFDFSFPVAYPYYLFEISGFLYRSVHGFLYPSIPVLAVALFSIGLSYYLLFLICEETDCNFSLAALILTFSNLRGLNKVFEWFPPTGYQISFIDYFHSGYHYLFGVLLGIYGVLLIRKNYLLSVLFVCLSFGFCGISAVWIGIAALGLYAWNYKEFDYRSIGIAACVLLPQFVSFLPRFDPSFSFSLPHFWFPAENIFLLFLIPIINNGIPIIGGIIAAFFLRKPRPILWLICVCLFLALCTSAVKTDWFGRGLLVLTVSGAIAASQLPKKFLYPFLILQGVSLLLELQFTSIPVTANVERMNQYPLGTVFYQKEHTQLSEDAFHAGRTVIGTPPVSYASYLNHPDTLENLFGIRTGFAPCKRSVYGNNTPRGLFIKLDGKNFTEQRCDE